MVFIPLFVYDFLYNFFGIIGGYKLQRMWLHCLRSPYDFFLWQTKTKLYRDLAGIVRQPQGYRTIIVLSSRPPYKKYKNKYKSHDARTMTLRKSQGVGTLTVKLSCNYVHGPCSFLHSIWTIFQSHVVTYCAIDEEASVWSWTWSQSIEQRDTFVYI